MIFRKISTKILTCSLLILGTLIPSEGSYASTVHPTGLKTLHETIPGIETLYSTTNKTLPSPVIYQVNSLKYQIKET